MKSPIGLPLGTWREYLMQKKWPVLFFFPGDFGLRSPPSFRKKNSQIAKKWYTSLLYIARRLDRIALTGFFLANL